MMPHICHVIVICRLLHHEHHRHCRGVTVVVVWSLDSEELELKEKKVS
jgi:hypothetical protein